MPLSSAKWGEQLFNIYFYLHSSMDIRPLSLLGLATVSLMNLLHSHSSASFITNHLFFLPLGFSAPSAAPGRVWSKSTEVTVEASRPWFRCSMLPWPCKVAKKAGLRMEQRIFAGTEKFLQWQRIGKASSVPSAHWSSPYFRSTFRRQTMPAAGRCGVDLRRTLPDSQCSQYTGTCVTNTSWSSL